MPESLPGDVVPEQALRTFAESLQRLSRGERTELRAFLDDVETHRVIDGTRVSSHCHVVTLDGNRRARVADMAEAVAQRVVDFAIPRSRIAEAAARQRETNSTAPWLRLFNEARSLFTDIANSGEGGELLLFVIAETIFRLPQLICKMSLKTNVRMHVHGADGLHVGVSDQDGRLALYWGESKIYASRAQAISECITSVSAFLREHRTSALRDLQLLQHHSDLGDPQLESAMKEFLNPASHLFNTVEFRALCLVAYDSVAYKPNATAQEVMSHVAQQLPGLRDAVGSAINEAGLSAFSMHFVSLPMPSAAEFRSEMRRALGLT